MIAKNKMKILENTFTCAKTKALFQIWPGPLAIARRNINHPVYRHQIHSENSLKSNQRVLRISNHDMKYERYWECPCEDCQTV